MKRLTVCVPSFDRATALPDCLESVLAQDFEDLTLLVADDASTDGSAEIVRAYTGCAEGLETILRPEAMGYARNVNEMLKQCETDYVAILAPCDRYVRDDFLSRAVAALDADPALAFYHSAHAEVDEDGNEMRTVRQHDHDVTMHGEEVQHAILRFRIPQLSTMVVRRCVLEHTGLLNADFQRATEVGWIFALAGAGDVHYDPVAGVGHPMEGVPGSTTVDEKQTLARRKDILRVTRPHCDGHPSMSVAWETSRRLLEIPAPFAAKKEEASAIDLFTTEGQEVERRVVVFGSGATAAELLGSNEFGGKITAFAETDPEQQGKEVDGLPILDPHAVLDAGAHTVVLSSKELHGPIEGWLRERLPASVDIVRLWEKGAVM